MRPFKLIRFAPIAAERIGPLAGSIGYYTCEKKHGIDHVNTFDIFYYYEDVSNFQLLKMWKRVLHISYFAKFFARTLTTKEYGKIHCFIPTPVDKYGLRAKTESFLEFTSAEKAEAIDEMKKININPDKPFICLLSRDSSYLQSINPSKDWTYHNYRNSHITGYAKTAEALTAMGNTFVRMGSMVSEPLLCSNPNVIDYAYKNYRTELLDIYLTSKCKFFITTGTGLDTLANVFNRPVLYVNYLPYTNFCFFPNIISLPKLLFSKENNRLLNFKEILSTKINNFASTKEYEDAKIQVIDNTPEEILDAALEMEMRLNKTWVESPEDQELQRKFWHLYPTNTHYHYRGEEHQSLIGAAFLRKYRHLLD